MSKIKFILALFWILSALPAPAAQPQQNKNMRLFSEVELARVCWYEGQQFSEGAIIKMAGTLRICAPRYRNQPESRLAWLLLGENGQAVYPQEASTVRVH